MPPVDVLEIGGPLNSVLIDEISKMKGSSYCVNQQTGFDLPPSTDQEWHGSEYLVAIGTVTATRNRFSGRRTERRLFRSCTDLMLVLGCLGTEIVWIWPKAQMVGRVNQ